ncbi:MAG: flagellar hook assembly protein FlgD [Bacillota bacterium]
MSMQVSPSSVDLGESSSYEPSEVKRDTGDELGKDDFLELLTTELSHQDPLDPMDNKDFISQMAQFSSLEQMNNMNSNMKDSLKTQSLSQGSSLVGKTVETVDSDSGETIEGVVEKVTFEDDKVYAHLDNGEKIGAEGISAIY